MNSSVGDSSRDGQREAEADRPDPRQSSLLERVMRETLREDHVEELSPQEMQALSDVARRHRGASLVLDPVAVDLVEALLRCRFGNLSVGEGFWHQASQKIAATLCEAPESQQRLSVFWHQLCELPQ
jgi:hypothetical protein